MTTLRVVRHIAIAAVFLPIILGTAGLLYFGSTTDRTLKLGPNESVAFYVFRTSPHPAKFSLYFKRNFGQHRRELGTDSSSSVPTAHGVRYQNPGEPVILSVGINSDTRSFEALPAVGEGFDRWRRPIQPYVDDGDDTIFVNVPDDGQFPQLKLGMNKVVVRVVRVGPKISNETATFSLHPAISKVHVEDGYGVYQWFIPFALPFLLLGG